MSDILVNVSTEVPENKLSKKVEFVVIESKFSGKIDQHMRYLDMCIFDTLHRGEIPFASHKMFCSHPLAKDFWIPDNNPRWDIFGRDYCIHASDTLRMKADKVVFYVDFGWSKGMLYAKEFCEKHKLNMEERKLDLQVIKNLNNKTFDMNILTDFLDYNSDNYRKHLVDTNLMSMQ
jgi:hypothetical protein